MKFTIKELRRAKNISQEEMAKICGVHVNTYRAWEDNPGEIKLTNAVIIAEKLKISIDDILFMPENTMDNSIY